ncbi:MAG: hypothetical protein K6A72_09135 [Lachnospiraceae bacterium]|nr:hypothetical protein [Lachnospiraceae bacterium]
MTDEELDEQTRQMIDALNSVPGEKLRNITMDDRDWYEFGVKVTDMPGCRENYIIAALRGIAKSCVSWKNAYWTDDEGRRWPEYGKLFHANSARTSLDYLDRGVIYSREEGVRIGAQTPQRSDALDQKLKIFNDLFFDNSDIAARFGASSYGPVCFVFNIDILEGQTVRITCRNPVSRRDEVNPEDLRYRELFYDFSDLKEDIKKSYTFVNDLGHHVTIFNTEQLPLADNLYAIYIEKCYDGSGREVQLKERILEKLRKHGMENVPVIIRPGDPVPEEERHAASAAPLEDLWDF